MGKFELSEMKSSVELLGKLQSCLRSPVSFGNASRCCGDKKSQECKLTCILQALGRLREAEEAAAQGHHQFLSGLLHNLAKALSNDRLQPSPEVQLRAIGLTQGWSYLAACASY